MDNNIALGFEDIETPLKTGFEDFDPTSITPETNEVPDFTKRVLAAAKMSDPRVPRPQSGDEAMRIYADLFKQTDSLIDKSQEMTERNQIAANRAMAGLKGLDEFKPQFGLSPEENEMIRSQYLNGVAEHMMTERKLDAEREAVQNIQELIAAGDETQAQIMYNNVSGANDSMGIMREYASKRLWFAQKMQEANIQKEQQGFFSYALDVLLDVAPSELPNFTQSLDPEAFGDKLRTSFTDFFTPGSRMRKQSEAFWSLPEKEFLEKGESLIQTLKDNATVLGAFDPTDYQNLLAQMNAFSEDDEVLANLWGGAGIAEIASMGGVKFYKNLLSLPRTLATLGARKEASLAVANALDEAARLGTVDVAKATGLDAQDITDNILPKVINPNASEKDGLVGLGVDAIINRENARALEQSIPVTRLSPDELERAANAKMKELAESFNREVKDIRGGEVTETVLADGSRMLNVTMSIGKTDGGGYATEASAKAAQARLGLEGNIKRDASGQFFIEVSRVISENGFYTNPIDAGSQSLLSSLWGSSQQLDSRLFGIATQSGNNHRKAVRTINTELTKAYRGLASDDRETLQQIILKGKNETKWYTRNQIDDAYQRVTGKPAPESVVKAYEQYRFNNDVEYWVRNDIEYKRKANQNMSSVKFKVQGLDIDTDAWIDYDLKKIPEGRVYNLDESTHYGNKTAKGALTQDQITNYLNKGYVIVRTETPIKLVDGTEVEIFLSKKSDFTVSNLRRDQLPYSPGGHRLYTDKYFVKQGSKAVQPDTGETYFRQPHTFITAPTKAKAQVWANFMEQARQTWTPNTSAEDIDKIFAQAPKGFKFPSGQEFLDAIDNGMIDKDEPFETLFDRELPEAYRGNPDAARFGDIDDDPVTAYYRTTGKTYYSKKGDHLSDYTGEAARTLDPFETQAKALYNVARISSFWDFKTQSIERWVNTYRRMLNIPENASESPLLAFMESTIKPDTDAAIVRQIRRQKQAIERILNFETQRDRDYKAGLRSVSEWITGSNINKTTREKLGQAPYWWDDTNPVSAMHSFASDLKLGLFNFGQFPIQISTAYSAATLSPKFGLQGFASLAPVKAYRWMKNKDNVLDVFVKRGFHKVTGFDNPTEFKHFVKAMNESGWLDIGDTQIMETNFGPHKTYSSMIGDAREAGRFFFNQAEELNRIVAYRIAWGETRERFPNMAMNSHEFLQRVAGRAGNYSFNMHVEAAAWWQKGLLSIPTQFWSYNARMIEAMVGKDFTLAQKTRLVLGQFLIAGTAGVPFVSAVSEYIKSKNGDAPDIETWLGKLDRGAVDSMVYELTGANIQFGEKWGTGSWMTDLYRDVFGFSEFNEKSTAEILGGATYSIFGNMAGVASKVLKYMTYESGNGEDWTMTEEQLVNFAKEASVVGNTLKAYMVYNYGQYYSNKNTLLADGLPPQDALFVAFGFRPGEMLDTQAIMSYRKHRKEMVDDAAKQMRAWRTEAIMTPDKYEDNMKKANLFINLVPADIKADVLREAHKGTPDSLYGSLENWRTEEDLRKMVTEEEGTTE